MSGLPNDNQIKLITGDGGYVLEDVPHLTDYIDDLPVWLSIYLSIYLSLVDCLCMHFTVRVRTVHLIDHIGFDSVVNLVAFLG